MLRDDLCRESADGGYEDVPLDEVGWRHYSFIELVSRESILDNPELDKLLSDEAAVGFFSAVRRDVESLRKRKRNDPYAGLPMRTWMLLDLLTGYETHVRRLGPVDEAVECENGHVHSAKEDPCPDCEAGWERQQEARYS